MPKDHIVTVDSELKNPMSVIGNLEYLRDQARLFGLPDILNIEITMTVRFRGVEMNGLKPDTEGFTKKINNLWATRASECIELGEEHA